jgi:peptidyl-prolyl cis-trans isomerase SurA
MDGGRSFEEASPEIEEKLYNDAVDKKYAEWLKDLKSQAHIKIIR